MTRHAPAANFDRIARAYRWLEYFTFGRALQRCRTHFLPALAECRSAIVLGDGDGRFLVQLLAANPQLHADAVDSSSAMLDLLKRRTDSAANRLRIHRADIRDFVPPQTYDLIVTHFFLDCLTQSEVNALAVNLTHRASPDALWLISDFRIPSGPMKLPAKALVSLLYLAFRVLTGLRTASLPDHAESLTAAGFTRASARLSLAGLLASEVWRYTPTMQLPPQRPRSPSAPDPVPDPEPPAPSLQEPDPEVFRHEPPSSHQLSQSRPSGSGVQERGRPSSSRPPLQK